MTTKKNILFTLVTVQLALPLQAQPDRLIKWWSATNEWLAALNFRADHAEPMGASDSEDGSDELLFSEAVGGGKILRSQDVRRVRDRIDKLKQELKGGARKKVKNAQDRRQLRKNALEGLLLRNRGNVAQAAREVKCIVIALIASVIIYRNRDMLGKRWEKVKDVISGAVIVWLCYTFRHHITNGVTSLFSATDSHEEGQ